MIESSAPAVLVRRLADATNAHDLDALVACFAEDYVNETPLHPARGFRGTEQVRRNWTQLFAGIPDLTARVLATAVDGDTVWSEWEMAGRRRDGVAHRMRGVIIFRVAQDQAAAARFYLEPVDGASDGANDSVDAEIARLTAASASDGGRP